MIVQMPSFPPIKDNSMEDKEKFEPILVLINKIADKSLGILEKEGLIFFPDHISHSDDLNSDTFIIQSINDKYKTQNIMGIIGYGEEQLQINSRFSNNTESKSYDYFLQYMLNKVLEIPNILDISSHSDIGGQLQDMMIFIFPYYYKKAVRKGLYKKYIQKRHNDFNIKGSLDIPRHIRQNTPFLGNISYNTREFSYDNEMMELVRHTVEYIKTKKYGTQLLLKIKDDITSLINNTQNYNYYQRNKVIHWNKKNPIKHAYFHEYQLLQNLCIQILQGNSLQMGANSRRLYGIVFDGAWLWEEYINTLVKEYFYHPNNKSGKGRQYLFTESYESIYPDFIGRNISAPIIGDAKYKFSNTIGKNNLDYYQLITYMTRFNSKNGFFFYPESDGKEIQSFQLKSGSTFTEESTQNIWVTNLGLQIPQNTKSFDEFDCKIRQSETDFLTLLKSELTEKNNLE